MTNMTLKQALGYLDQVDALYFQTYTRRCELAGEPALGVPGRLGYTTVAEVAGAIRRRHDQIQKLRAEIEVLSFDTDTNATLEIVAVCGKLGIPCQQG